MSPITYRITEDERAVPLVKRVLRTARRAFVFAVLVAGGLAVLWAGMWGAK